VAVKDVSFSVSRGEVVGLLGPNGAGKTTIMKMLTCYHYPDSGSVVVNQHDVFAKPLAVRRSVGYVPEHAPLYPDLTVAEYLDFIAGARSIPSRERPERIRWALSACGLEGEAFRSIKTLSKGYRQRVSLAQAVVHDPPVLVLDEPTVGLDPNQISDIRRLVADLGRHKTILLSTHILQEVEAVCGRVLILNRGRLVARGTADEISHEVSGESVFSVSLKGIDESAARSGIKALPAVTGVLESTGGVNGTVTLRIAAEADTDVGEGLFDWAVAQGCKIVSLYREPVKLEDVFSSVTSGGGETRS
jgi:ABC-2 type transport system ATP-binding protein